MESYTIKQLKAELKARGASLRGKKADLIERLKSYIKNDNFVRKDSGVVENEHFTMVTPPTHLYRDINGDSMLPLLTKERIMLFHLRYGVSKMSDKAKNLYVGKYLQYARFSNCQSKGGTFISGKCRAQMKQVFYTVDLLLKNDGSILESQCECAAGIGPYAHCKHIGALLLAVADVTENKKIILAEVCTQTIQTFHKPKRPFHGSPKKAKHIPNKKMRSIPTFDPRPVHLRKMAGFNDSVNNICINYAATAHTTMPILQTLHPANTYALYHDHDYIGSMSMQLYKKLGILTLTEEDIINIEINTRGQAKNEQWLKEKSVRVTSTKFKDIYSATERRDMNKLCESIINPQTFVSRQMEHGILNEPVAIQKYTELTGNLVNTCGLFVVDTHPYLGASPDGLVGTDKVIEVKCPYTARDNFISPVTVPYLEIVNGALNLKKNHTYYFQVQGQLLATKRNTCDFIVHTYKDTAIINIKRNQELIEYLLVKLAVFADLYFLPAIREKYLYLDYGKLN